MGCAVDSKVIASGFFEQATDLPELIEEALDAPLPEIGRAKKVCVCGVGNSGLAGDVISDFADGTSDTQVCIVRDLDLPGWVDSDTAVILLSYSGETREVISSYSVAKSRGCSCIIVSSGGKLTVMGEKAGDPVVRMRPGLISRNALGCLLGRLAAVLEKMGICYAASELRRIIPNIKTQRERLLSPDNYLVENIARMLLDRIPVIYSLADMRSAAIRWKTQINENTKALSFCGSLPEFNHNEIVGWADDKNNSLFIPVILYDDDASEMVRLMTDASIDILEEKKIELISYHISGGSNLDRNLNCIQLGDFVSCYLAYLHSIDARRPPSKSGMFKFIVMERTS